MSPDRRIVEKALTYCVDGDRLLVLRHLDYPAEEVGLQVPGGTIRAGELAADAARRELAEETGHSDWVMVADLGTETYDITPYRHELQRRHFFLFRPTVPQPERWMCSEAHDGTQAPTRLEAFWIPLAQGHVLQAGQGARLWAAVEALKAAQPSL